MDLRDLRVDVGDARFWGGKVKCYVTEAEDSGVITLLIPMITRFSHLASSTLASLCCQPSSLLSEWGIGAMYGRLLEG